MEKNDFIKLLFERAKAAGFSDCEAYVASGEPLDKAGAYAIQGRASLWITRLEGSDTSVVGLPLYLVRRLLLLSGYPLSFAP